MKKISTWLCLAALAFCLNVHANLIGEEAEYTLNTSSSRTSWMISSGQGKAKVVERKVDETLGPSYVVTIDYDLYVLFYGSMKGSVGLLVPEAVFTDEFYADLVNNHPVDLGSFKVDYEGTASATDNTNTVYEECIKTKIYDIDQSKYPITNPGRSAVVLWHEHKGVTVENLVIKFKMHPTVPVLGAVQIDISGQASGFNILAGVDLVP